jgi:putative endonuclease
MVRQYFVYIATNITNTTLYTGVTNHLARRIFEHKMGVGSIFTSKYQITKLLYYEIFSDIHRAIEREKQIKAGSRKKKHDLIVSINPLWEDLFEKIT